MVELTDANSGDKIRLVFSENTYYRLIKPKFLHDDKLCMVYNTTTSVMMKFILN